MSKQTDLLIQILEAGSNLIIENASNKDREMIIRLAQTAVRKDVHLTIRNCGRLTIETLVAVAKIGGKKLTIEA